MTTEWPSFRPVPDDHPLLPPDDDDSDDNGDDT